MKVIGGYLARIPIGPIIPIALFLAALAIGAAPVLAAEMNCRVPFSFVAAGETLPPGLYHVSKEIPATYLTIRGNGKGVVVLSTGMQAGRPVEPMLLFEKHGDEYVLSQVWMGGRRGRQVIAPREGTQTHIGYLVERVAVPAH
jgi:hypothetical protein